MAFPNVAEIDGQLPTEVDRTQILTFGDLEECLDASERLMARRFGQHPLGEFGLQKVIDLLRPNCEFRFEAEARARHTRARRELAQRNLTSETLILLIDDHDHEVRTPARATLERRGVVASSMAGAA